MSFEEKSAWLSGVISVIAYVVYLAIVLPMLVGVELGLDGLSPVAYELPLLATLSLIHI